MSLIRYAAVGLVGIVIGMVMKTDSMSPCSLESVSRSLGEASVSLFNTLGVIEPKITIIAIVIIIAAVLALETMFELMNEATRDTSFHKMVSAVEKELMLVGCTAFLFKIIVNADIVIEEDWMINLEYSDLLVPLFSFSNCFIGVMLIFLALRQCHTWSKGFHLPLQAVLEEFDRKKNRLSYQLSLKPLSSVVSEMEFRIFHGIFCNNFKVQRAAFAFDTYVELVLEKFIVEIIEIRPINWVLVVLLMLINFGRTDGKLSFYECEEEDILCVQRGAVIIFTICGAIMLFVTIVMAIISRRYEVLIIRKSGVNSIDGYPQYLKELESQADFSRESVRLNKDELKLAMNMSRKNQTVKAKQPTSLFDYVTDPSLLFSNSAENSRGAQASNKVQPVTSDLSDNRQGNASRPKPGAAISEPSLGAEAPNKSADEKKFDEPGGIVLTPTDNVVAAPRTPQKKLHTMDPLAEAKATHFLESIFFLSSPTLYFEAVRLLIMMIALYLTLWILNFAGSDISSGWKFLSVLPAFLCATGYFYIVKTSSLLRAIHDIDEEAVLEVLESTEGSRLLGLEIREKLLQRLDIMNTNGDVRTELKNLFNEIDDNGSNRLSKQEFEDLLKRMDIQFSKKKWKKIFHQMDLNFDDSISFEEFINFLFPDDNQMASVIKETV